MSNVEDFRKLLERKKGQRQQIARNMEDAEIEIRHKAREIRQYEKAREVVREIATQMQSQLQLQISDITSMAMDAVFTNPYKLEVDFVLRRNKTECDLYFERGGFKVDPLSAAGLGSVDIASFALRIASWIMMEPRPENTIILDEPFRFLSEDNHENASRMVKELSERLGIQFIIVTHNQTLASYADKVFRVSMKKGKSIVNV